MRQYTSYIAPILGAISILALVTGCNKQPNAKIFTTITRMSYPLKDPVVNIESVTLTNTDISSYPTYVFVFVQPQFTKNKFTISTLNHKTISINEKVLDLRTIDPGIYLFNRLGHIQAVVLTKNEEQHIFSYLIDENDMHYGDLRHDSTWIKQIQKPLLEKWQSTQNIADN